MKRLESKVTNFLKSRVATVLMVIIGLLAMFGARGASDDVPTLGAPGFFFPSPDHLLEGYADLRFWLGIGLTVLIGVMMESIDRTYNVLRSDTHLFLGAFMLLQAATPMIVGQFTMSLLLNIVVLGVMSTFYTVYQRPRQTRPIFMAFCIMSAGMLYNYAFGLYMLVFLPAFYQMRCPSTRMYLAALMGAITPWWLALGFGWASFENFSISFRPGIFTMLNKTQLVMMLITVGLTVILALLTCLTNMVKIYSYNSKARSLSGLLAMLTLFTAIVSLIDVADAPTYLSTLNCLAAFQIALFYRIVESRRGYIYLLTLIVALAAIYCCNIWL